MAEEELPANTGQEPAPPDGAVAAESQTVVTAPAPEGERAIAVPAAEETEEVEADASFETATEDPNEEEEFPVEEATTPAAPPPVEITTTPVKAAEESGLEEEPAFATPGLMAAEDIMTPEPAVASPAPAPAAPAAPAANSPPASPTKQISPSASPAAKKSPIKSIPGTGGFSESPKENEAEQDGLPKPSIGLPIPVSVFDKLMKEIDDKIQQVKTSTKSIESVNNKFVFQSSSISKLEEVALMKQIAGLVGSTNIRARDATRLIKQLRFETETSSIEKSPEENEKESMDVGYVLEDKTVMCTCVVWLPPKGFRFVPNSLFYFLSSK